MHAKEKLSREFSTNMEHLYSGSGIRAASITVVFQMQNTLCRTVKPKLRCFLAKRFDWPSSNMLKALTMCYTSNQITHFSIIICYFYNFTHTRFNWRILKTI